MLKYKMSAQPPPQPFPLNPVFNFTDWSVDTTGGLTIAIGDARYLLKAGDNATGLIGFNAGLTATTATIGSIDITSSNYQIFQAAGSLQLTSTGRIFLNAAGTTTTNQFQFGLDQLVLNNSELVIDSGSLQTISSTTGNLGKITIKNGYTNSSIDLRVANGSGVLSSPFSISSATTTISNATTINNLSSTTQTLGNNTTAVATCQFVQSAIGAIPSTNIMPYMWGFSANNTNFGTGTSTSWLMFFPTGVSMGQNAFITIEFQLEMLFNTPSTTGVYPYYQNWSFQMDIYPSRLPFQSGTAICLPNGYINGNNAFSMTDPTYAPNGRWYWVKNYSNTSSLPAGAVANPFYFWSNTGIGTGGTASQVFFQIIPPMPNTSTGSWRSSCSCRIINQGVGAGAITSNGTIASNFGGGSYYTSF